MRFIQAISVQWQKLYGFLMPPKLSRVEQMLAVKSEAERNRELGYLLIILILLL